jgi:uracil-DNA glycosylase
MMKFADSIDVKWRGALGDELSAGYINELEHFLLSERSLGKEIFPKACDYFRALELTALQDTRVVILGQDPYHGEGQAHGLSFSVPCGVKIPPSLRNIYKELEADIGISRPEDGLLNKWARQGVLLLNAVLSVEKGLAASHQGKGWENFTDAVIRAVNLNEQPVVFLLWGAYAQKKASFVDENKHLVLRAPHPSPLSAHRGFLGCKHFSQANEFLKKHHRNSINWQI